MKCNDTETETQKKTQDGIERKKGEEKEKNRKNVQRVKEKDVGARTTKQEWIESLRRMHEKSFHPKTCFRCRRRQRLH